MKTIGLLGGMTWHSTLSYYRAVNEETAARLGGLHSAKVIVYSLDFHGIDDFQKNGRWDKAAEVLCSAARSLEAAGADMLLICANTMHKVAPQVEAAVSIPLVHIADAAAEEMKSKGLSRAGLLGTRFTMEEDFYSGRLRKKHGLETMVPGSADRELIHRVIYEELGKGLIRDDSRREFLRIIGDLESRGAQAVILGCTEIPLLVHQEHTSVPLLDTMSLHARRAVILALG